MNLITTDIINSGFDNQATNMDAGFQGVTDQVGQGFVDQNAAMTTGLGDVTNQVNTGFADQATNMNTGFQGQLDAMANYNAGVADRFNTVDTSIGGLTNNLNTYYGDLAGNQQSLLTNTDGIASQVGDLQTDYTERTNVADRQRGELIDSVAGTAQATQSQIAAMDSTNALQAQQAQTAAANTQQTQGNFQQGQPIPTPQQNSQQFVNSLGIARRVLQSGVGNMNPALAVQLGEFASAFTPQGELIPNGMDAQGRPTIRGIDPQGNLGIAKLDPQGNAIPQGTINLNQIQAMISQIPQGFMGPSGATY
jgi:hypothetical protein